MNKEELLKELADNSYVMLQPSPIAGIGVFAIRDIPRGCRDMFSPPDATEQWHTLTREEADNLPAHAKFLVENYCLFDADHYYVPAQGFKKMDLCVFLNHSGTPNIISINGGDHFEAVRDIKAGEELLIDYGEIVEE